MSVERDWIFRTIVLMMVAAVAVALVYDGTARRAPTAAVTRPIVSRAASATRPVSTYRPQMRDFTITTVPFLVHEQSGTFDYLTRDFSKKGVLAGKEVWGFSPSSLTVYAGDTVRITLVNPSGDDHTFTLPSVGFNLVVKALSVAHGTFVAPKVGPYEFVCTFAEHAPYMNGQLVVLPDSSAPQS
jgi:plastocyanin